MSILKFDSATPAAPAGNNNVTWQYDATTGKVSGYVPQSTSPLTTKGDVFGFSTVGARIPVGSNGQVLTADSAQTLGVKWATPASGGSTNTYGAYSSLPGSPNMGDTFDCSDSPYGHFVYNGSIWVPYYRGMQVVAPAGSWSWVNQGTSAVTAQNGGALRLTLQQAASNTVRAYVQAKAGSNYTVTICCASYPFNYQNGVSYQSSNLGIALYDNVTGKSMTYYLSGLPGLVAWEWANTFAFASREFTDISSINESNYWLRIVEDGTHRTFYWSTDGLSFVQVQQVAAGTYLTPTHVGVGMDVSTAVSRDPAAQLLSFSNTTP